MKLLTVPYKYLYLVILVFCCIGVYSLNNSTFDVFVMVGFGFLGCVVRALGGEPAPLIMGMVLGPMMEEYLRRSMQISRGDPTIFIDRPISATLLAMTVLCIALMLLPVIRKSKDAALQGS